ncbi:glycoside hydrolase family 61 protein [Mucidula mucida]|nr:glycoside hydrolase family 61 protein [Mucidula mucida]
MSVSSSRRHEARWNISCPRPPRSLCLSSLFVNPVALHNAFVDLPSLDIWTTLVTGDGTSSTAAVRTPVNNSPVTDVESPDITCNVNPSPATETVSVAAGSMVGFLLDNTLYHQGPAAIYLGTAPTSVAEWDGSGANWFKIAEWGAEFDPFGFTDFNLSALNTTIPASVPNGEYLIRIEQIGLHVAGAPQWYISCAQIAVTGGGTASPSKVSIPGYVSSDDPSLTVNIYNPVPTAYTVPGPAVFTG